MNNFINDLLQKLVIGGIEIKRLDASVREGKQSVANGIVYASARNGRLLDVVDKVLFISKDISSKNKKLRTLLKKLNSTRKLSTYNNIENIERLQSLADNLAEQPKTVETIDDLPNLPKQEDVAKTIKQIEGSHTSRGGFLSALSNSVVTEDIDVENNSPENVSGESIDTSNKGKTTSVLTGGLSSML
nr:MAG TPA: hypothetical protein [Caudoviricetes sp.]